VEDRDSALTVEAQPVTGDDFLDEWGESTLVCAVDGIQIGLARSGVFVHLDALPKGVDPEHCIVSVTLADYAHGVDSRDVMREAAQDMLLHHATFHPSAECEWAQRLARALRL